MKTLFVASHLPDDHKNEYPPLGIAYLAAVMREKGKDVSIMDLNVIDDQSKWKEALTERIETFQPDIIGIYIMSYGYLQALEEIKFIREKYPDKILIAGGPHVTIYPKKMLEYVDYSVSGEAEITYIEMLERFEQGKDMEGVLGVTWKKRGIIVQNEPRPFIEDLDSIPFPWRDGFDVKNYSYYPKMTIMTSRGCPYGCYYCFRGVFGRSWRGRGAKNVVDEIKLMHEKYGTTDLIINDDLFTFNKKRVIEICDKLIDWGVKIKWQCFARVDCIDKERIEKMRDAGCTAIRYGVETGDEEIMKKTGKGITLERAKEVVKWTRDAGVEAKAFFMIGHPWDTKESVEKTIKFAKEINADIVQFSITTPYPGTELWEIAKKMGIIGKNDEVDWNKLIVLGKNVEVLMHTPTLTEKDIRNYKTKAERDWAIHRGFSIFKHPGKAIKFVKDKGVKRTYRAFKARIKGV